VLRVTENRFEAYDLERDPASRRISRATPTCPRQLRAELAELAEQELQPR